MRVLQNAIVEHMDEMDTDRLLDAITAVVPPVLTALETLAYVSRHLHPPNVVSLADAARQAAVPVREGMDVFKKVTMPDHLAQFAVHLEEVVDEVCLACDGLDRSVDDPNGLMGAYRALRHQTRAIEALYPIALVLPPVGRFFIEEVCEKIRCWVRNWRMLIQHANTSASFMRETKKGPAVGFQCTSRSTTRTRTHVH